MTAHSTSDFFLYNSRRSIPYAFFEIFRLSNLYSHSFFRTVPPVVASKAPTSLVTAIQAVDYDV